MALPKFTMQQLMEAGVHFGHHTRRWNPLMTPYVYGVKDKIHIINLNKTAPLLHRALVALEAITAAGGKVLFVATKHQAKDIVKDAAERCGQFYVNNRWLGGMLTNWTTVSQSIRRLKKMESDIENADKLGLTKKEVGVVAGHNKEGAKLSVNNAILDLKIRMITQPGYFGSFIGSHDAATSSYSYKNVAYINEDYSDIAENITKDIKAYDVGEKIISPEDARGWEENTFIRDFNTNLFFQYDSIKNRPVLALRNESELSFTHDQFERYVDELVEDKPTQNHYYLIKAGNILAHLSNDELAKVDATKKSSGSCHQPSCCG